MHRAKKGDLRICSSKGPYTLSPRLSTTSMERTEACGISSYLHVRKVGDLVSCSDRKFVVCGLSRHFKPPMNVFCLQSHFNATISSGYCKVSFHFNSRNVKLTSATMLHQTLLDQSLAQNIDLNSFLCRFFGVSAAEFLTKSAGHATFALYRLHPRKLFLHLGSTSVLCCLH